MPLITCPECGKQISDKSEFCVGCGCPRSAFADIDPSSVGSASDELEITIEDGVLCDVCYNEDVDDPYMPLESFVIPDGVTVLGNGSQGIFTPNPRHLTIPEGVTHINYLALAYNDELEELVLPKSVELLDNYCLAHNTKLKKLTLLGVPKQVGYHILDVGSDEAEDMLGRLTVKLPEGMSTIPQEMFNSACTLGNVEMPKTLKKIERLAFAHCDGLTTLELPEGLEEIGNHAFMFCRALRRIVIPASVKTISYCAFNECKNLTEVVLKDPTDWSIHSVENPDMFGHDLTYGERIALDPAEIKNPSTLARYLTTTFCDFDFERGAKIEEEEEDESTVESCDVAEYDPSLFIIEDKILKKYTGTQARVSVPKGVTRIESFAFAYAKEMEGISLPDTLTSIGDHAFYGAGVNYLTVPDGVEVIGEEAFANCVNLKTLGLPKALRLMGKGALTGCKSLGAVCFSKINGWVASIDRGGKDAQPMRATMLAEADKKPSALLGSFANYYWIKK